jgi:hypothetical protein
VLDAWVRGLNSGIPNNVCMGKVNDLDSGHCHAGQGKARTGWPGEVGRSGRRRGRNVRAGGPSGSKGQDEPGDWSGGADLIEGHRIGRPWGA